METPRTSHLPRLDRPERDPWKHWHRKCARKHPSFSSHPNLVAVNVKDLKFKMIYDVRTNLFMTFLKAIGSKSKNMYAQGPKDMTKFEGGKPGDYEC